MSWVLSLTNLERVHYDEALHTAKELLINSWFNPSWTSERTNPLGNTKHLYLPIGIDVHFAGIRHLAVYAEHKSDAHTHICRV